MPVDRDRAPLAKERARHATCLLIVDMISTWDFPDAEKLAPFAEAVAPRIAKLKARCAKAGIPALYVNDNLGQWRSDFRHLVEASMRLSETGTRIGRALAPDEDDYFVLKPKQSGFYATPLDLLLRHLGVKRLVITGVSADMCIAFTASEARMRDYDAVVPQDCVASQTRIRNQRALRQLRDAFDVATPVSTALRLTTAKSGRTA